MRESTIEGEFKKQTKHAGWWCLKLKIISHAGFPDRMLLKHPGLVVFVEVKATLKKPRPLQSWVHKKLRKLGFEVYVIDSIEDIAGFIKRQSGMLPTPRS